MNKAIVLDNSVLSALTRLCVLDYLQSLNIQARARNVDRGGTSRGGIDYNSI